MIEIVSSFEIKLMLETEFEKMKRELKEEIMEEIDSLFLESIKKKKSRRRKNKTKEDMDVLVKHPKNSVFSPQEDVLISPKLEITEDPLDGIEWWD